MSFYGYNPAEYRTDYRSMFGVVGAALDKTASMAPELMRSYKEIKENRFFKEKAFQSVNEWLDKTDDNTVTNIASSMGIQYDPNDPMQARNELKKKVINPDQLGDKVTNEDYAKRIAVDFFNPYITAARSKAGGGSLTMGQLFANLGSGDVQQAIRGTDTGKELLDQEKYNTDFQRKYGEGGEYQTQGALNNQSQLDLDKQKYDVGQQRGSEEGDIISQMVTDSDSSEKIFTNENFSNVPYDSKLKAFNIIRQREGDELKEQLKSMDQRLKTMTSGANKPVSFDDVSKMISSIDNSILNANQKIANIKANKNIDNNTKKVLIDNATWGLKQLEQRKRMLDKVELDFTSDTDYTIGKLNESMGQAKQEVQKEDALTEKGIIDQSKKNKWNVVNPFSWGRGDDKKNAQVAYKEQFGRVNTDDKGEIIPQFSTNKKINETPSLDIRTKIINSGFNLDKALADAKKKRPDKSEDVILNDIYVQLKKLGRIK